jgi:hypothetical protein
MYLKEFHKPKVYNSYWTHGPGCIYQIDMFSISGLLKHIGYWVPKGVKRSKGPWVLTCIDMYSRYTEAQYVGLTTKMSNVITAFEIILEKMGKPIAIQADSEFNNKEFTNYCKKKNIKTYFWKGLEKPKNQLVERVNKTLKQLMLRYINEYGWPEVKASAAGLPQHADLYYETQKVLDACTWYYNRKWHKGIKAIPYEVFNGYDINHGDVNIVKYENLHVGTIVLRKPTREKGQIKYTIFGFDPEPFVIDKVEGEATPHSSKSAAHQGKYQIRSLVTDTVVSRWYKPYELRIVHKALGDYVFDPLVIAYLRNKYGDEVTENFLNKFAR